MAEFCKDCFKSKIEFNAVEEKIVMSEESELCEGCGEIKPIVISYKE